MGGADALAACRDRTGAESRWNAPSRGDLMKLHRPDRVTLANAYKHARLHRYHRTLNIFRTYRWILEPFGAFRQDCHICHDRSDLIYFGTYRLKMATTARRSTTSSSSRPDSFVIVNPLELLSRIGDPVGQCQVRKLPDVRHARLASPLRLVLEVAVPLRRFMADKSAPANSTPR
jgi:hypothetical protein